MLPRGLPLLEGDDAKRQDWVTTVIDERKDLADDLWQALKKMKQKEAIAKKMKEMR